MITLQYKFLKLADGEYWETIRSKYEDISKNFIAAYSNEEKEGEAFPTGDAASIYVENKSFP